MTEARADFDTAITLLADMLEERFKDEEFEDDFEPWAFLRETMPPLADRLETEALAEVREEFLARDPNNASRMRDYFED